MNILFLFIVALLIVLAVFDLVVGVSNDAVNFLSSAIGARVARFRTIAIIAAVGVFLGASMSNGMMDVARHGIMTPLHFSFYDVMCVFLAVMLTDVILLDVFNTLGMPTSTTVSLVFELLGGSFAIALMKIFRGATSADGSPLSLGDLLNTEKAMSVILGIFLSVAIAFALGALVQWVARLVFTYTESGFSWLKKGVLAGVSVTAIVWFLLINGLKGTTLMTPQLAAFIAAHTWQLICGGVVAFSLLAALLCALRVGVLRLVVLLGTLSLAMAFASNDLVNFVGVPLTALDAFGDFTASGAADPRSFMMASLMGGARTPALYLMAAGCVMVLALVFSRKARDVVGTSVNLSRQYEGDEMFGSSAIARALVRAFHNISVYTVRMVPQPVVRWADSRFNTSRLALPDGAAFDHVRAIVNLVVASLLVALGTSLRLPLSTTYVTFMVAMGSSLADRAWSRESAVFRVTGVLSVIGGWFVTAGVAFICCYLLTNVLYFCGLPSMVIAVGIAMFVLVRSNLSKRREAEPADDTFRQLMRCQDEEDSMDMLKCLMRQTYASQLRYVGETFATAVNAFFQEDYRGLRRLPSHIEEQRKTLKRERRRGTLGLRRVNPMLALERNTWYFLSVNALAQLLHSLERLATPCREHVGNNFSPVPSELAEPFVTYADEIHKLLRRACQLFEDGDLEESVTLRTDADRLQRSLSLFRKTILDAMQRGDAKLEALSILLNMVQESQEMLSGLRHALRGASRFLE